jgi:hypothetical protein
VSYLMGFFKLTNDVAVMVYQNPRMPAKWRVYFAVVLACVQDASRPALLETHENLAELAVGHLAAATGLPERSVRRALAQLEADGLIVWNKGDGRHKPTFSVVMRPGLLGQTGDRATRSDGGEPTRSPLVFESAPDSGVKKGRRRKKAPDAASEDKVNLHEEPREVSDAGGRAERTVVRSTLSLGWRVLSLPRRPGLLMSEAEARAGWERVRSGVRGGDDHGRAMLRKAEPSVVGDRLTLAFEYGMWRQAAERFRPQLEESAREWLGPGAEVVLVDRRAEEVA